MTLSRIRLTVFRLALALLTATAVGAQSQKPEKIDRNLMRRYYQLQKHMVEEQKQLGRLGAQIMADLPKGFDPDVKNRIWVPHVETQAEQLNRLRGNQSAEPKCEPKPGANGCEPEAKPEHDLSDVRAQKEKNRAASTDQDKREEKK